jgi:hypothetical protein
MICFSHYFFGEHSIVTNKKEYKMYVLVMVFSLVGHTAPGVINQEFNSAATCSQAQSTMVNALHTNNAMIVASDCFPK